MDYKEFYRDISVLKEQFSIKGRLGYSRNRNERSLR